MIVFRQDCQSLLNQAAYFATNSVYSQNLFPINSSSTSNFGYSNSTQNLHH